MLCWRMSDETGCTFALSLQLRDGHARPWSRHAWTRTSSGSARGAIATTVPIRHPIARRPSPLRSPPRSHRSTTPHGDFALNATTRMTTTTWRTKASTDEDDEDENEEDEDDDEEETWQVSEKRRFR